MVAILQFVRSEHMAAEGNPAAKISKNAEEGICDTDVISRGNRFHR
jgi:hypothetical protein